MSRIRSDLWCGAFVRRHNDVGNMCVVAKKGDPIAGQVWIEFDHLDGTSTLLTPSPSIFALDEEVTADLVFQIRYDRAAAAEVAQRIVREAEFDPDFWHLVVESRQVDNSLTLTPKQNLS